jgi:hypothetical protein
MTSPSISGQIEKRSSSISRSTCRLSEKLGTLGTPWWIVSQFAELKVLELLNDSASARFHHFFLVKILKKNEHFLFLIWAAGD